MSTSSELNGKDKIKTLKLMLIGEAAVGKSSIMYRYTMNSFNPTMLGTAGIDFKKKEVQYNDTKIKIILYDTAGHDRFRKIIKNHCKGANGIVVVYDLSEEQSIERLSTWMSDIEENAEKDVELLLFGNKSDKEPRMISQEKGIELSKKYRIPILETSAKTGYNIEEAFSLLINNILKKELHETQKTTTETKEKEEIPNKIINTKKKKNETDGCKCIIF